MTNLYLKDIESSSRRVLGLMDKNPIGFSSGCFDKNFWHFKKSDYPTASSQMGIAVLAKLWNLPETNYFRNQQVLKWIEQGILFLKEIQHSDGSFDEWYANERGWAGPTGYIMNACLDCHELLHHQLSPFSLQVLKEVILDGISFLEKSSEGHMIANHLAIVILPLIQAKKILNLNSLSPQIEHLIKVFKKNWCPEEGWSLEYDGADPGYQSASLSFFAKSLQYQNSSDIREFCLKSLNFISYFAYPSGSIGGNIGSRETVTLFCAGVEYFRGTPLGARLSSFIEQSAASKQHIFSPDTDDHYVIYRLNEILDAYRFQKSTKKSNTPYNLPFERDPFEKIFKKAGILVKKHRNKYVVISLNRGGALRVEDTLKRKTDTIDSGVLLKKNKKIFSSLCASSEKIVPEQTGVQIEGYLQDVTPKLFTPITFIIFRCTLILFGRSYRTAFWIKKLIKKILIFNQKSKAFKYKRRITFSNKGIEISTKVKLCTHVNLALVGGGFWTRYVPQSRYYLPEHLQSLAPYYFQKNCSNELSCLNKVNW